MNTDEIKEVVQGGFESFCDMWEVDTEALDEREYKVMISNYYLDIIASQLIEINKPRRIIAPVVGGRS